MGNDSGQPWIPDLAGSASGVRACIRCRRKSESCLLEGREKPPLCVPVRLPISAKKTKKRDTGRISLESPERRLGSQLSPRNKIRRYSRGNPHMRCTLRLSRIPYPRSPCYSNLSSISDWQFQLLDGTIHSGSRYTPNHHYLI